MGRLFIAWHGVFFTRSRVTTFSLVSLQNSVPLLSEWLVNFYWTIGLFLWPLHFCVVYNVLSLMTSFSEMRDIEINTWLNVASPFALSDFVHLFHHLYSSDFFFPWLISLASPFRGKGKKPWLVHLVFLSRIKKKSISFFRVGKFCWAFRKKSFKTASLLEWLF